RLMARLSELFGLLSLILATVGIYGVTAFNAGSRTNEIGVRMALGASRPQVVRLVLWGAVPLIIAGLLLGVPLAFGAGKLLGSQLYGMSPYNLAILLGAVVVLGAAAGIAALIPALRASSISPTDALRA